MCVCVCICVNLLLHVQSSAAAFVSIISDCVWQDPVFVNCILWVLMSCFVAELNATFSGRFAVVDNSIYSLVLSWSTYVDVFQWIAQSRCRSVMWTCLSLSRVWSSKHYMTVPDALTLKHCTVLNTALPDIAGSTLSFSLSAITAVFPCGPGLAGTRMSPFWILLELRVTEVVSSDKWWTNH